MAMTIVEASLTVPIWKWKRMMKVTETRRMRGGWNWGTITRGTAITTGARAFLPVTADLLLKVAFASGNVSRRTYTFKR